LILVLLELRIGWMPVDVVFVPFDIAVGPTLAKEVIVRPPLMYEDEVIVGLPLLDEDEPDSRHIGGNCPGVSEAAGGTPVGEDA
jgi:hypothetical protein